MTLPKVLTTAPEWICLQVSDTEYDQEQPFPDDHEGITWCQDSVMPCEVAYIRADLSESRLAAADALLREVTVTFDTSPYSSPFDSGAYRKTGLIAQIKAHLRTGNTEAK